MRSDFSIKLTDSIDSDFILESVWDNNHWCIMWSCGQLLVLLCLSMLLKYGFCKKLLLYKWTFEQLNTLFVKIIFTLKDYCKLLILWICLVFPKGHTTMIFSQPDSGPNSESIEPVNFLRRIEPQTNVMPKSFTLGGFSHSAVECSLDQKLRSFY